MQISARRHDKTTIFDLSGDIDFANSPGVRQSLLREIQENRSPRVAMNLSQVLTSIARVSLPSANLTLTDSEATQFWPVYAQYSADMEKINDTRTIIAKEYSDEYGTLTDEQADRLIRRWLDADIEVAKLRQKYVPVFWKVLPGKKAATFFQPDRRISMTIDEQVTSQLPLVQGQE